jgi:Mg-chelatase subunit ChlD
MSTESTRRWRLILGHHSEQRPGDTSEESVLKGDDNERDQTLQYLFDREHGSTPTLEDDSLLGNQSQRGAGRARSPITPVTWLGEVRRLFPASSVTTLQTLAIERYGLTQLLKDPKTLREAEPSLQLVTTLLSFEAHLHGPVKAEVRRIVATVVRDLEDRLSRRVQSRFHGRRRRHDYTGRGLLKNLDWHRTLRQNLKHYDADLQTIIPRRLYFNPPDARQIPWHVFLVVDQSGSMAESVIHSAIISTVFARIASLRTHLLLFDTDVVDMTPYLPDPLETLMAVQLGGGTDIAKAMQAVALMVEEPRRSIVVLITDFDEGGDVQDLCHTVTRLKSSGVNLLGLGALTHDSHAYMNTTVSNQVAACGMAIASLTPDGLATWVADAVGV